MPRSKRRPPEPALIKEIRQLRSRQTRLNSRLFYAEGNRTVAMAVQAGYTIEMGVCAPELITSDMARETIEMLESQGVPIEKVGKRDFDKLSFKGNPSGVGAVVHMRDETLADVAALDGLGWVVLDGVGNAGNLGAISRTCDAVGCTGIMLLGNTTDPYHPDAVRASMGALFAMRLVRASWDEFVAWKQQVGVPVVGAAGTGSVSYREATLTTPTVLLMGSERLGLSAEKQAHCDSIVHIPMIGTADSLNLGVATSILLYEIFHQQRQR